MRQQSISKVMTLLLMSCSTTLVLAASLKQQSLHDYVTERYYLGLDSNRVIERKMTDARMRGDQVAQHRVVCVDLRQYYRKVIALNQANRHFDHKKIDADTKTYRGLLKDLDAPEGCAKWSKQLR